MRRIVLRVRGENSITVDLDQCGSICKRELASNPHQDPGHAPSSLHSGAEALLFRAAITRKESCRHLVVCFQNFLERSTMSRKVLNLCRLPQTLHNVPIVEAAGWYSRLLAKGRYQLLAPWDRHARFKLA